MKNLIISRLFFVTTLISLCVLQVSALFGQENYIYFSSASDSIEIESIKVENLTTDKHLNIEPNAILHIINSVSLKSMALEQQDFNIFPNPSESNFYINYFAENSGQINFTVYNISGSVVYRNSFYNRKAYHQVELKAKLSGIYFIQISGENFSYYTKLVGTANETYIEGLSHTESVEINDYENEIVLKQSLENTMTYSFGDVLLFTFTSTEGDITKQTLVINQDDYFDGQYIYLDVNFYRCVDIEGKHYPVIEIANRVWMAENLNTKYFNDNTEINKITDNSEWRKTNKPAYSEYNNSPNSSGLYGKLYNWYVVDYQSSVCPEGWYLPSDEDWKIIENLIEVQDIDEIGWRTSNSACYLKTSDNGFWTLPAKTLVNSTGFTALPGGMRALTGEFHYLNDYAAWWTSTEFNSKNAWCRALDNSSCNIFRENGSKSLGLSLRCVYQKKAMENELPVLGEVYVDYYSGSVQFFSEIISHGLSPITEAGFMWSIFPNFDDSNSEIYYVDEIYEHELMAYIENIEPNQTFYVKAFARNSEGIAYSEETSFVTNEIDLAFVEIMGIDSIYMESAKVSVFIESDEEVSYSGIAWDEVPDFTIGNYGTYYPSDYSELEFSHIIDGLEPNKTYYVKAFAQNSGGLAYSTELSFTTLERFYTTESTLIDIDGNEYKTVRIANTEYMAENLRTSRLNDGTLIPLASDQWVVGVDLFSAYMDFDSVNNHLKNGKLYNSYVLRSEKICPDNWKVANEDEWQELELLLGMSIDEVGEMGWRGTNQGGMLKQVGLDNWFSPNHGATNQAGYSAQASGYVNSLGEFVGKGEIFSTWVNSDTSRVRTIQNSEEQILKEDAEFGNGYSIRCIRTGVGKPTLTTQEPTEISVSTVKIGANILDEGESPITEKGVLWGEFDNLTLEYCLGFLNAGSGSEDFSLTIQDLNPNEEYYVRAYATNDNGTAYGEIKDFQTLAGLFAKGPGLIDEQGNMYKTIVVDDMEWMSENLRISELIALQLEYAETQQDWIDNSNLPAYCKYENFEAEDISTYGYLYNFAAVMSGQGSAMSGQGSALCPDNWVIPNNHDWARLEMFLGLIEDDAYTLGWRGTDQGGMLKEAGSENWLEPNTGATNITGLNYRPGGMRDGDGNFSGLGEFANIWTSSLGEVDEPTDDPIAYSRHLKYDSQQIGNENNLRTYGFSVRCVKISDYPTVVLKSADYLYYDNSIILAAEGLRDGGFDIVEKGFVWSLSEEPSIYNNDGFVNLGEGLDVFYHIIPDVEQGATYRIKAYLKQFAGDYEYSNEISIEIF